MDDTKKSIILIVDDNFENLQVLGNTLKERGYIPAFAQSGEIALNYLKKKKPDLILLDVMMPEMDGYEVCKILKKNEETKDIPVIFLTAITEIDAVVKGFEYGGVDYVTKPFNVKELMTRISTHLELKNTKEKLLQKVSELELANKTKDRFFSIIGHDLSNLFGSFINLMDIWEVYKEESVESIERSLLSIQNSAERGYSLLVNLLDWSRSQTGKLDFKPEILNLKKIVDENLELLGNNANNKNITLSSFIGESICIFADKNMLNTIIRNLMSNAIKFTPVGGKVEVNSGINKDYVEITISDNGIGIHPEDISKLFKIDVDHKTLGTKNEQGTGIGLILCKEFIEKHNGKIWVESILNKGSNFYVSLPKRNAY
ncbi:MAG: hybrid sensor histidine kinase/response regulator [Leptospiraceae bacterium]|nr:hybrid sensor histidine kinase/response regulator [Leptospiraceae bacterium]MCP5496395.1 hybrid sensor histidine kinase/response regulator [Leptospiraceae bacterium]